MASTLQRIRSHLLIRALGLMPPRIRWAYYPVMIVQQAVWVFFMNIILAFIMKDVLDAAVRGDMALLERAIYLAVSAMCAMPLGCTLGYWFAWCLKRTATAIRERTFTQMNALTMQTFETRHSGEMVSQLSNDVDVAQRIFGQMGSLVSAFLYGVGDKCQNIVERFCANTSWNLFGLGPIISARFSNESMCQYIEKKRGENSVGSQSPFSALGRIFDEKGDCYGAKKRKPVVSWPSPVIWRVIR